MEVETAPSPPGSSISHGVMGLVLSFVSEDLPPFYWRQIQAAPPTGSVSTHKGGSSEPAKKKEDLQRNTTIV
jgi:hypothetical protein